MLGLLSKRGAVPGSAGVFGGSITVFPPGRLPNQHKLNRATHCNPWVAPFNVEGSQPSAVPLLWVWRRPAVAEDVIQAALQTRTLDAFPVCLEHVVR